MRPDIAATDALADSLARLLPALESFTRFEGADPAARRTVWRAALDEPLPETGAGREAVLETLRSYVIANGLRIGAPGFSGWVTTMPTTVPAVAQLAGAITAAQRWWATPGNFLEVLALRWLQRLVGLPDHFEGGFTSGGATANLLGLAAARQHAGESRGFDPSLDGLQRLVEPRVYASTEVHHVVHRACGVLGLGRRALRMIPVDASRTPDLGALERFLDEDLAAGRTP
ncbi:MAG TPA: pyridoxal-dependent decarboxylase, partial [Thermoanaerobaculia bacterium]|nr:pyridoxal-dependent decarboxylase [Thermoanaerobaculia bacterium]